MGKRFCKGAYCLVCAEGLNVEKENMEKGMITFLMLGCHQHLCITVIIQHVKL